MPGTLTGLLDPLVNRLFPIPKTQQGNRSQSQKSDDSARDQDVRPREGGSVGVTVRVDHGMGLGARSEESYGKETSNEIFHKGQFVQFDTIVIWSVRASGYGLGFVCPLS